MATTQWNFGGYTLPYHSGFSSRVIVATVAPYTYEFHYKWSVNNGYPYLNLFRPEDYYVWERTHTTAWVPSTYIKRFQIPTSGASGSFPLTLTSAGTYYAVLYCGNAVLTYGTVRSTSSPGCTGIAITASWHPASPTASNASSSGTSVTNLDIEASTTDRVTEFDSSDGLSLGAVVGISIGATLLLCAIVAAITIAVIRRRIRSRAKHTKHDDPEPVPSERGSTFSGTQPTETIVQGGAQGYFLMPINGSQAPAAPISPWTGGYNASMPPENLGYYPVSTAVPSPYEYNDKNQYMTLVGTPSFAPVPQPVPFGSSPRSSGLSMGTPMLQEHTDPSASSAMSQVENTHDHATLLPNESQERKEADLAR